MRARDRNTRPKSLICLSPGSGNAPSSRSIAEAPAQVLYAARTKTKASCVRRGGLPDSQAPEKAWARLSLLASFARAVLAALCVRPNALHTARAKPVAEPVAPRKAVPRQDANYIGPPASRVAHLPVGLLIYAEPERRPLSRSRAIVGADCVAHFRKGVAIQPDVGADGGAPLVDLGAKTRAIPSSVARLIAPPAAGEP